MTIEKIISKLQEAESVESWIQRDKLESAFNLIALEIMQSMKEAGRSPADGANGLILNVLTVFDKNFK